MKITLIQGPYYPVPALLHTGVEKFWYRMGGEFARRGNEVVHVSRRYPGLADREVDGGVSHVRIPSRNAPKSPVLYRLYDIVYSLRALAAAPIGADILITNCIWLPIFVRSARKGRAYVHVARFPKGQMHLYRHAPRIQTVSTAVAEAIVAELPGEASRVRVVPPCLPSDPPDLGAEDFSGRAPIILYVGRIHPEKGVHFLIEAFSRLGLEGWRLVLAGSSAPERGGGGEAYARDLRRLAGPGVTFAGSVPQAELDGYYRRASLLVYPSLAEKGESFGMVPLEAMACGCPSLVSDLRCFRDYLEPGVTGAVFDHRGDGAVGRLADAMRTILADEALRVRLARSGYGRAHDFRLEPVVGRYLEDFAALIRGDGTVRPGAGAPDVPPSAGRSGPAGD